MKPPYIIIVAGPNGIGKTTFAKWYLRMFADCELIVDTDAIARELEYYIAIRLLWVPSVRITIERVEMRRQNGGHSIGLDDQLRRFDRCCINFFTIYRRVCHDWELYLGIDESNESFARGEGGLI